MDTLDQLNGTYFYDERTSYSVNSALKWLIAELTDTLKVSMTEIFRHPEVSYKVKTEAGTARW